MRVCVCMFLKMDIGLGRSYLGLKEKFMHRALPSLPCSPSEPCVPAGQPRGIPAPHAPTHQWPSSRSSLRLINPHSFGGRGASFAGEVLFLSSCLLVLL